MDNLEYFEHDNHLWEVGYFGEQHNGYSAYGFRQDGVIIRVTSKYEAELFASLLKTVTHPLTETEFMERIEAIHQLYLSKQ